MGFPWVSRIGSRKCILHRQSHRPAASITRAPEPGSHITSARYIPVPASVQPIINVESSIERPYRLSEFIIFSAL